MQTYDCKWGDCRGCGIPGNYADIKLASQPEQAVEEKLVHLTLPAPAVSGTEFSEKPVAQPPSGDKRLTIPKSDPASGLVDAPLSAKPYVLHYTKKGPARFLSHLNIMKLIEQAMIRADLRLRFTEGFNPHPKFATSPAIPLGMTSQSEYIQLEAYGELPENLLARMNEYLPEGLVVQSIVPFESKGKWSVTQPLRVTYKARIEGSTGGETPAVGELLGRANDLINHLCDHYKGNDFWCSSRDHERIVDLWIQSERPLEIGFTLSVNPDSGALMKPRDFLEQVLLCPPDLAKKCLIAKESVHFTTAGRENHELTVS